MISLLWLFPPLPLHPYTWARVWTLTCGVYKIAIGSDGDSQPDCNPTVSALQGSHLQLRLQV